MSTISWKEHFGNRVTGYDPIEAQGLSELGYALKHNQISQEDYLQWARAAYELCSLDVKFFQSFSPSRELFERLKDIYSWGPECLPVAEWDEHVIIVGLEKPTDLPPEIKPIFLLAPLEGLTSFWELYNSEDIPVENANGEAPQEATGMPEGLSIDEGSTTSTNLSFAGISLNTDVTAPKTSPDQPKVPPSPPNASASIPEIKAAPIILSEELELKADNSQDPSLEETEVKAQPQIVAVASGHPPLNEDLIHEALNEVKSLYEKRVYIEFNTQNKTAKARLWPQDFVATEAPSEHSLQEDSFLSIVFKTQKPYHGYVVKSPVVEKFFSELNQGEIPENLTLAPLVQNGEVVGAIAGWGPKTSYTLATLRQMESITHDLGSRLGWVTPEAA